MRVFGVVGWKNAGKTTLMERLVTEITGRGHSVSTLKHAHHVFEIDRDGADSMRHRQAGAHQVLIASRLRWALMTELRDAPEPAMHELLARLSPVDLVLIEGYKRSAHAKIEAHRVGTGARLIARDDPTIRAIATDGPIEDAPAPLLPLNDPAAVADFILRETGLL